MVLDELDLSKMRTLFSFKQKLGSFHEVQDLFGGKFYADINRCEGLTFSSEPNFKDPSTQKELKYAFKLSDAKVRILIMVKCDVGFSESGSHIIICF